MAVAVAESLARRLRLKAGDRFEAETRWGRWPLKVGAVLYDYSSERGLIYIDAGDFVKKTNDRKISGLALFLDNPSQAPALARALRQRPDLPPSLALSLGAEVRGRVLRIFDETFQVTEALKIEHDIHQEVSLIEATVLLGRIALTLNDMSLAETCVQHALQFVERQGVRGIEHPAMVYLTGYQVLQVGGKFEAAQKALVEGYQYLTSVAAQLEEAPLRESYLTNIPEIRELRTLYQSSAGSESV